MHPFYQQNEIRDGKSPMCLSSFSLPILMSYLISSGVPISHAIKGKMIFKLNSSSQALIMHQSFWNNLTKESSWRKQWKDATEQQSEMQ